MAAGTQVAVIGAGPLGASVAYWLARAGVAVRVYDAGVAGGEGASRHSGGMTRRIDPDPVLDRLSQLGTGLLQRWQALGLPGPAPLRPAPLWWLLDDAGAAPLRERLREHPRQGVRLLRRDEALHRTPELHAVRSPWVLHDAGAGTCDVRLLVRSLLWGAQERGARLHEHCPVRVAVDEDGRIDCRSALGGARIEADVTVLAMGQGLPRGLAGARVVRRSVPQVQVTGVPTLPGALIDAASGTYLRPGGDGDAFVGWSGPRLHEGQCAQPDLEVAQGKLRLLAESLGWRRLPQVLGLVAGTDAYTEDFRPLCEWAADRRHVHVSGLSGRGLKYAALLGASVAETIARRGGRDGLARLLPELDELPAPFAPFAPLAAPRMPTPAQALADAC